MSPAVTSRRQNAEFNATIALSIGVVSFWVDEQARLAVAAGDDLIGICALREQIRSNRFGTPLRKLEVGYFASDAIRVSRDFSPHGALPAVGLDDLIQNAF